MKIKTCEICNKEFKLNSNSQKYCSPECSKIAKRRCSKQWVKENQDYHKKYNKQWYKDNPEYDRNYRQTHKQERREHAKNYYQNNKQKLRKYRKQWEKVNRKQINMYNKQKRNTDINFKLADNLRKRLNKAVKNNQKSGHMIELLGCSVKELKSYLQNQFTEGMTWDNYGYYGWHIDHVKPCALFDLSKPEEQKKCFNYKNLQPLWAEDNWSKGGSYEKKRIEKKD